MLDKEKLRARREKEMVDSVNVWTDFLKTDEVKKEIKTDDKKDKK